MLLYNEKNARGVLYCFGCRMFAGVAAMHARSFIMPLLFAFYAALWVVVPAAGAKPGADAHPAEEGVSALEIFRALPSTIFENTLEGLSEDEKERLLSYGQSAFWILLPPGQDDLELVSLPFGDTRVFLHVYRERNGSSLAIIGANSDDVCSLELWHVREAFFSPADTPPEPPVTDFFAKGNKMPKDVQASIFFCVDAQGLKARAVFWNERGMAHVPVDNDLRYVWNGKNFEKKIVAKVKK